jgi:hypothetical protein
VRRGSPEWRGAATWGRVRSGRVRPVWNLGSCPFRRHLP